jgi:hypothetical protein
MANPFPFTAGQVLTAAQMNGINESMTAYTPTWTGTGGTPTLGNGTLTGHYTQVNKFVFFRFRLGWGSTTSATSISQWTFTLPVATATSIYPGGSLFAWGVSSVLDSGVATYRGTLVRISDSSFCILASDGANLVGSTVPFTFGNADSITAHGFYEVA